MSMFVKSPFSCLVSCYNPSNPLHMFNFQRHEDTVWDSASRYWAHWPSKKKSGSASLFHFSGKISLRNVGNFNIKLLLLIYSFLLASDFSTDTVKSEDVWSLRDLINS